MHLEVSVDGGRVPIVLRQIISVVVGAYRPLLTLEVWQLYLASGSQQQALFVSSW